jgi:hypothetical protein
MKPALPRARQFKANWAKACDEQAAKSGESRRAFSSNATEVTAPPARLWAVAKARPKARRQSPEKTAQSATICKDLQRPRCPRGRFRPASPFRIDSGRLLAALHNPKSPCEPAAYACTPAFVDSAAIVFPLLFYNGPLRCSRLSAVRCCAPGPPRRN